jgi:hypothetical protein
MVKGKGEYPLGLARTRQGIGHLSHHRTHPSPRPMPRKNVSPDPLLGLRTLKGGGFGLTQALPWNVFYEFSLSIIRLYMCLFG